MAKSKDVRTAAGESNPDAGRRDFIRAGAVAGLAGAAGVAAAMQSAPAAAQLAPARPPGGPARPQAGPPPGPSELPRPPGLAPRGALDNRFPITFETSIPNGMRVVTALFKGICERDPKAIAATLQFPFASYEFVTGVVVNTPQEFLAKPPASLNMNPNPERGTDNDGHMKAGSYDMLRSLEAIVWDPTMCCVAMTYDRYDKYGKRLLRCEGVYFVTNNDGRWGVELMSTIFKPNDLIDIVWEDTIMAARRTREHHVVPHNYFPDDPVINSLSMQPQGPSIGITSGGQSFSLAKQGRAMEAFKIKGMKSRLRVRDRMAWGNGPPEEYEEGFKLTGVGNWGWSTSVPDTRVIHHNSLKAHVFTAASRFNIWGELASMDGGMTLVTFERGVWGIKTQLCLTARHDHANDVSTL